MATFSLSTKRLLINKNNSRIFAFVAIVSAIAVFSLVSSRALLTKQAYQGRVIDAKEKAVSQLKANKAAVSKLEESYKTFIGTANNVIGGSSQGRGEKDGDNAKIVLDALPSKYDFPALASSLEKILNDRKFTVNGIEGSDDELAQSKNASEGKPKVVDIPFDLSVASSYTNIQELLKVLDSSIRPMRIDSLTLSGTDSNILLSINAKTYYLPEKKLTIEKKVIK